MIAYKLMRIRKNGSLGSLFINKKAILPIGEWLKAYNYPTKGFAVRFGWHLTFSPHAPHLTEKNRIWVAVEIKENDFITYDRPESQGGAWILANNMKIIKILNNEELSLLRLEKYNNG